MPRRLSLPGELCKAEEWSVWRVTVPCSYRSGPSLVSNHTAPSAAVCKERIVPLPAGSRLKCTPSNRTSPRDVSTSSDPSGAAARELIVEDGSPSRSENRRKDDVRLSTNPSAVPNQSAPDESCAIALMSLLMKTGSVSWRQTRKAEPSKRTTPPSVASHK